MRTGRDGIDRARGHWLLAAALLLLLAAPGLQAQGDLRGLDGDTLTEASLRQGATIAVVWASWSPRCREIPEQVKALREKWSGKARVITINFQEDAETARAFLAGKQMGAPVYFDTDGAFSKKHAITWLPGMVVFQGGDVPYKGRFAADADKTLARFFP